jgi:hypothetical protein
MKKINRIGELHSTKQGDCIIIEYNNCNDMWVEFQDKYKAKVHVKYRDLRLGNIKNPYHPNILNVGCFGMPKQPYDERAYRVWNAMLHRCYNEKTFVDHPTYRGCTVCERWLCFEYFLEDLPLIEGYDYWLNHPNERVALDKDIKGNDSKIYCLEYCCFVTNEDNIKESRIRNGSVGFCSEPKPIVGIHKITGEVVRFKGGREAQRELGISQSSIGACCRKENKYRSAGGYYWYFAEEYDKLHK